MTDLLVAEEAGDYPIGVPAAVLLSLDAVRAWDPAGACNAVMELTAVLSPAGIGRELVYAAAAAGLPGRDGPLPPMAAEAVDAALARLTGASLLTFSLDGTNVSAHRLVMRIIRETLPGRNVGNVADHFPARLFRGEIPADQVGDVARQAVLLGQGVPPRPGLGAQAQLTHQPADQLGRAPLAAAQQGLVQAPVPVLAVVRLEQRADLELENFPSSRRLRFRS